MTTCKPGIITQGEFRTLMWLLVIIVLTFLFGVRVGTVMSHRALEQVLEPVVPITYIHHPTVEGRFLS